MGAIVLSVHVGKAAELRGKPGKKSAIDKRPVQGGVPLGRFGFQGDVQVDRRYHGGPHKAVCAYCACYYSEWTELFNVQMPPGSFGENIHLGGIADDEVCLGDIYAVGSARLRVTGPRGPCSNLSAHWGAKDLHLEIKRQLKTGFYLEVLQEGAISAGDPFTLEERPHPDWSIPDFWRLLSGETATEQRLREIKGIACLDPDWAPNLRSVATRLGIDP